MENSIEIDVIRGERFDHFHFKLFAKELKEGKYFVCDDKFSIQKSDRIYKGADVFAITSIKKIKDGTIKEICKFNVRNKNHLKNIIIPIFNKYPILTNKHYDYLYFKDNLLKDIKYYK